MFLRIPPFVYAFVLLLAVGFLACGTTAESHVPVVLPEATAVTPDTPTSNAYTPSRHEAFLTNWCIDALKMIISDSWAVSSGPAFVAGRHSEAVAACIQYLASVRE